MGEASSRDLDEAGFVVLRGFFEPHDLSAEVDVALADGVSPGGRSQTFAAGDGTVTLAYVPMMCELTPVSLDLLDRLSALAARLLTRPVLPGRAKGTEYRGATSWHRDSDHDVPSIACVAYLDPLTASSGALRVIPGSHLERHRDPATINPIDAVAVESEPGDVVVFDEHLVHGSEGGSVRRQWRCDFVVEPVDALEVERTQAWFAQSLPDEGQDPGYDAVRYPTYGPHWMARERPWSARLRELAIYDR